MKALQLVSMAAAMAALYLMNACSGDEDTPAASAGSSGQNTGGKAGAGTSAGTGGAQTAGTGASVTTEECLASHFSDPAITSACEDCMCECNATAASACDETCWNLARCIQVSCAGNMSDITC